MKHILMLLSNSIPHHFKMKRGFIVPLFFMIFSCNTPQNINSENDNKLFGTWITVSCKIDSSVIVLDSTREKTALFAIYKLYPTTVDIWGNGFGDSCSEHEIGPLTYTSTQFVIRTFQTITRNYRFIGDTLVTTQLIPALSPDSITTKWIKYNGSIPKSNWPRDTCTFVF